MNDSTNMISLAEARRRGLVGEAEEIDEARAQQLGIDLNMEDEVAATPSTEGGDPAVEQESEATGAGHPGTE